MARFLQCRCLTVESETAFQVQGDDQIGATACFKKRIKHRTRLIAGEELTTAQQHHDRWHLLDLRPPRIVLQCLTEAACRSTVSHCLAMVVVSPPRKREGRVGVEEGTYWLATRSRRALRLAMPPPSSDGQSIGPSEVLCGLLFACKSHTVFQDAILRMQDATAESRSRPLVETQDFAWQLISTRLNL